MLDQVPLRRATDCELLEDISFGTRKWNNVAPSQPIQYVDHPRERSAFEVGFVHMSVDQVERT